MYTRKINSENNRTRKVKIFKKDRQLRYAQVVELWQSDESFRAYFVSTLKDAPFESFRWETPPVTQKSIHQLFEFVILDSPYLAQTADPSAFRAYFEDEDNEVIIFPNLGRDATLIVPTPKDELGIYAHLASFLRGARDQQIHALWRAVGKTMQKHIHQEPIWLSTAGGSVPWLHIRMDSRPKYYLYHPYKKMI
jgi:hypothetical protein